MYNYKIILKYDGTRYSGWQKNKNATDTIQEKLETLLSKLFDEKVDVIGSGRTDKGVHALGQVANFHVSEQIDAYQLQKDINHYLPDDIGVISCEEVPEQFHSRLKAKSKTYRYTFYKEYRGTKPVFERKYMTSLDRKLDVKAMERAIPFLVGEHDFKGFSSDKTKKTTTRTIESISIVENDETIVFEFVGNGFLHFMVRILVGTLVEIGLGKRKTKTIGNIFENKVREEAGYLVPAEGLALVEVKYD
jgi:tRNA pseudouridine38-40 synthase